MPLICRLPVLVFALHGLGFAASAAPPNVLLILSDDQAWMDYGFMGHPQIQTPRLDRLAKESVLFTRGYVPTSLCRASLASIITGLHPHQHKITSNDPPRGTDRAAMLKHIQAVPTLPKLLAEKGYLSFQSGKWWEGNYKLGGFTHGMTHGDPARGGRHGDEGLKIGREGLQPIFDFIEQAGERPFFVWYAPMLPHSPHNPPPRLLEKHRDKTPSPHVARYWAMCEWWDETCGELLDHLDEKGLSENTLVIYLADNGWVQDADSPRFAPRSKRSPYDGGLRTPILFRWPGKIAPHRDEKTLVQSIDIVPTILSACGFAESSIPKVPGVNLFPYLTGESKTIDRDTILGAIFSHDAADIDEPAKNVEHRWCISGRWKLIEPRSEAAPPKATALYDLLSDPLEEKDLAGDEPERVEQIRTMLSDWWTP